MTMTEESPIPSLSSPPKQKANKPRKTSIRNPRSPKSRATSTPKKNHKKIAQHRSSKKKSRSHRKKNQRSSKEKAMKAPNNLKESRSSKQNSVKILTKKKKKSPKTPSPKSANRRMSNTTKHKKQSRSNPGTSRRASNSRKHSPKRYSPHRNGRNPPRPVPIWELSGFPREYYEPVRRPEESPPPAPPPAPPLLPAMERNTLPITKLTKPVQCDVEFVALFLTPRAVQTLKEFLLQTEMSPLPDHPIHPPHVTLWFRPSAAQAANYKSGQNCEVKIVGFAKHELIQAVEVDLQDKGMRIENRIPHITISVQEEIPAWYSNGLLEMSVITKVDKGPILQTVVGKRYRDGTTVTATVFKKEKSSFYEKLLKGGIQLQQQSQLPSSELELPDDPAIKEFSIARVPKQRSHSLPLLSEKPHSHFSSQISIKQAAVRRPHQQNKSNVKKLENIKPSLSEGVIKEHHKTPKALDTGRDDISGEAGLLWKQIRNRRKKLTVDELKELLPTPCVFGKDFRIWPKHGLISMMFAKTGRTELVKYLVNDLGFNINQQRQKDFCTMLHVAAYYENFNMLMVQTLIDLGADPLIKNAYGEIPLVSKRVGKKRFAKIKKARGKQQIQQLAEKLNKRKPNNRMRKFGDPPAPPPPGDPLTTSEIFIPIIPPVIPLGTSSSPRRSPLVNAHTFYKPPPGTRPHPVKRRTRKKSKRKSKAHEQPPLIKLHIPEKSVEPIEVTAVESKDGGKKPMEITPKPVEDTNFSRSNDNDSTSTLRLSAAPSPVLSLSPPEENAKACTPEVGLPQVENQTNVEEKLVENVEEATGETKSCRPSTHKSATVSLGTKIVLGKKNNKKNWELFGDHRESNGVPEDRATTSNQNKSHKDASFADDLQFLDDLA